MGEEGRRQQEMILSPNEFALIRDDTKGEVSTHVGPLKTSLAASDQPVVFDEKSKRFIASDLRQAVMTMKTAPEGYYIVLKNPSVDSKHAGQGKTGKLTTPELSVGKKINVAGPCSFALFPGQMAKVVAGHHLKSNEYLLVRVYDEAAARENAKSGVVRRKNASEGDQGSVATDENAGFDASSMTMGELFVIKGTDVSFYIPPTGIEVVPENDSRDGTRYVRQAVTLERLEYCLLLDQNGNKRYEHGPAVVFPLPTETFVEKPIKSDPERAKAKKFRAVELSETSGIYVKVISDYKEGSREFKTGEELFITGRDQMIYFPRDEHAIIKYGEQEIHYGVAIPDGEARYVLNRLTGKIRLEVGPKVFLPDPRHEVITKRVLQLDTCELLYPGNAEARAHNESYLHSNNEDIYGSGGGENALNGTVTGSYSAVGATATPDTDKKVMIRGASKALAGDSFDRKNKFTKPRSIVLNTRYDGAVTINVWNGYAVKLVRKNGEQRVVVGPQTAMLEYDEEPQILSMSRGKPKGSQKPDLRTAYLRVTNNHISDEIEVETRDFVKIRASLSYKLNFVGTPDKWFDVDNYVKLVCDNTRSKIRNAIRKYDVRSFYSESESILRDIILGKSAGDGSKRAGTVFEENGLHIYDVEVLDVTIADAKVSNMLESFQRTEIEKSVELDFENSKTKHVKMIEELRVQSAQAQFETFENEKRLQKLRIEREFEIDRMRNAEDQARVEHNIEIKRMQEEALSEETNKRLARESAEQALKNKVEHDKLEVFVARLKAETESAQARGQAFSPALIAALQGLSDAQLTSEIARAVGPLKILGIDSDKGGAIAAFSKLLDGTSLGSRIEELTRVNDTNGNGKKQQTARQ